jgi:hypothetical protein
MCTGDQRVSKALMIPFEVIVFDIFTDSTPKMMLAKRNEPIQAFIFYRSHKPFGVRIRFRRPIRNGRQAVSRRRAWRQMAPRHR